MKHLIPAYAVTLFTSAFLLFSVQPMVGKFLLPLLGGGPSVWNTAMLFFQLLLLGGYAYAHAMAHFLKPKTQFIIHMTLFALAACSLPLTLPPEADPTGSNPLLWQLGTMILMAAGPFFILSSTAPLLQQWFSRTSDKKAGNPYFLYVASNFGSMLALLAYPIVIEPFLRLHNQSITWSWGYAFLGGLLLLCGLSSKFPATSQPDALTSTDAEIITWKRRGKWLLLAFVPSSLMLGVTTFITTDVTTVPLFWVIPLSLYLLSFIIAFSEKPFFTLPLTRIIHAIAALMMLFLMVFDGGMIAWNIAIIHMFFFFFAALLCHQELAALKPKPKHLTEFYLLMSLGGALGGIFNNLLAPIVFLVPYEYVIVIFVSLFCRYLSDTNGQKLSKNDLIDTKNWKALVLIALAVGASFTNHSGILLLSGLAIAAICFTYQAKKWLFLSLFLIVMIFHPLFPYHFLSKAVTIARNYYGVIQVADSNEMRYMIHGVINHGGQNLDPKKRFDAFGYYGAESGLADSFDLPQLANTTRPQEIGILGLGTGSTACFYTAKNRHFDYFEIDPDVIRIAETPEYFSYLSDCGVNYTMHQGDGRLLVKGMADKKYDLLNIDVFSSDNIPMHIITKQAVDIYLQKIKPDGLIVFHVSNRFFVLNQELAVIAKSLDAKMVTKRHLVKEEELAQKQWPIDYPNQYVVITKNQKVIDGLKKISPDWKEMSVSEDTHPWTDDYANILRALIWR